MTEVRDRLIEKLEALTHYLKTSGPLDPTVFNNLGNDVIDAMGAPLRVADNPSQHPFLFTVGD